MQNRCCGKGAYTNEIASTYEEDRKAERIWNDEQAYMEKVVRILPEGSIVLDIPVGTGRFLELYQEHGNQVVGVDISDSMLDQARKKIVSPLVQLEKGDVETLSYPDKMFDFVVCWRLLHLIPPEELHAVISELARVSSRRLYLQAYVRDSCFFFLRIKALLVRGTQLLVGLNQAKLNPWSHIQSFAHEERLLFKVFSECNLEMKSVDIIGNYAPLRAKVYVLEKMPSK